MASRRAPAFGGTDSAIIKWNSKFEFYDFSFSQAKTDEWIRKKPKKRRKKGKRKRIRKRRKKGKG